MLQLRMKTGDKDATSVARPSKHAAVGGPSDVGQRRQQKIDEHLGVILASSDTLQACMGPILCDTLEMCTMLKTALVERVADSRSPMVGVENSMTLIQVYLQTIRQAERLANLDCRIQESRSARASEETG
jgi:hypothetical protein